jgi:trehalose 2-sulfotransferase
MSAAEGVGGRRRDVRPFQRIRRSAGRWGRHLGIRLGLLPRFADCGYMICTTPRSGSNYLCQLLASTGQLGSPLEYFNTLGRRKHTDPKYPKDPRAQIDIIRSTGATPNGIYAVKVMPLQYYRVDKAVDLFHELPNLKFVRLRRGDLLGQAISVSRVQQTGQFRGSDRARAKPIYDAEDIRSCIRAAQARESIWDHVMLEFGVQPLTFEYEDIMRDPQAAVDQVAALMGLAASPPINPALVRVTVQRDHETEAWRQRFLADADEEFRYLSGVEAR